MLQPRMGCSGDVPAADGAVVAMLQPQTGRGGDVSAADGLWRRCFMGATGETFIAVRGCRLGLRALVLSVEL